MQKVTVRLLVTCSVSSFFEEGMGCGDPSLYLSHLHRTPWTTVAPCWTVGGLISPTNVEQKIPGCGELAAFHATCSLPSLWREEYSLICYLENYKIASLWGSGNLGAKVFFYWSRADLQCCVSFRCTAKWFSYTYIYIYSLKCFCFFF